MYIATLSILKPDDLELVVSFTLGIFARPSTAERLRKEMQKHNPELYFLLRYEKCENIPVSVDRSN